MRRILIIAGSLDRSERALIEGLRARGIDAALMLDPGHLEQAPGGMDPGRIEPLALRSRLDPAGIRAIRARLVSEPFDLVHCFGSHRQIANALAASARVRIARVAYRGTIGHLSRWDPASRLSYLNPRIDRIICVSDAVRRYLSALGIPSRRLLTIHKGHDVTWYRPAPRTDLTALGVPRTAFVVGVAAQMRPVKGVAVLLRAFNHLPRDGSVHALLVGEVRDRRIARLSGQTPLRNLVHLTGFRADAAALMGACDAFAMPSLRREGLPRAVIEAMAQAVPPIVTRVGGMPELVADRDSGLVVPPGDAAALAAAILRLRDDVALRRRLGERARKRVRTDFSIARTVELTARLYEELAGPPSGDVPARASTSR